ncbi:HNH endonuclease [Candidatus Pacearchaeota archaeon]|nr:HNH endonuclease [Candidatus Pacearchaeota archaeon]
MITQDLVKDLFNYNPETGILTRKINKGSAKAGDIAGSINSKGYLLTRINGKKYLNHRIIFLFVYGYLPEFMDHVDNNRLNNKIENLRECTWNENQHNALLRKDNKSGIKCVTWHKATKKWMAAIRINKQSKHLGVFSDIKEAKKSVDDARIKYHGEFANNGIN